LRVDEAKRLAVQAAGDDVLLQSSGTSRSDRATTADGDDRHSADDGSTSRRRSASKLTRDGSIIVELASSAEDVSNKDGAKE
jgi:hypothetical protein